MTTSYEDTCPNCGQKDLIVWQSDKPIMIVTHLCLNCGFSTSLPIEYKDLEELNYYRAQYDLRPLSKLPEQKKVCL